MTIWRMHGQSENRGGFTERERQGQRDIDRETDRQTDKHRQIC